MEEFKNVFMQIIQNKIVDSLIIVIISFLFYRIVKKLISKAEHNNKINNSMSNKSKTYFKMLTSIIRYIFAIVTILIVLQINNVDVSSMLAGVGIAGAIFGLAIQDALKDIIRGSSILSDHYFSVGDIIKYDDMEGKVLVIGLKTTKVQDLKTNNIISIANRNIEKVEIVSNLVYINIPMPYEIAVDKAEKTIDDITSAVKKLKNVDDCKYKGVNTLADSSINYLIEVHCNPDYKLQVRRDALKTILLELENNNIQVPYKQIDIHNK